jgi:hypothetical protein
LRDPGLDVVETVDEGVSRNAQFKVFARQIVERPEESEAVAEPAAEPAQ